MQRSNNCELIIWITSVIVTGAMLGVIMPLVVTYYDSMYFILVMTSIQFCIIFGITLYVVGGYKWTKPTQIKTLLWSGFTNGMMSICMLYAVDATRTPILIQSILAGAVIVPTVGFTRFVLNKNVIYDKLFIIPSLVCLLISIMLSFVPISSKWSPMSAFWIVLYAIGIIFRSAFSILQEKYITDTQDFTFLNKMILVFYSRVFQLCTLIIFFWLEYVIGYKKAPPQDEIAQSWKSFISDKTAFLMLEGFVLAYLLSFVVNVYLNAISTNYNMVSSSAGNNLTVVFFEIFPKLNKGATFPIIFLVPCMAFSVISIIFWIKGETTVYDKISDHDHTIPENIQNISVETTYINKGTEFNYHTIDA